LPAGVALNHSLQLRRGSFSPASVLRGFCYQATQLRDFRARKELQGARVMEIGPGRNLIGCVICHLLGAEKIIAFDHLPHASFDLIRELLQIVSQNTIAAAHSLGVSESHIRDRCESALRSRSLNELLQQLSIDYRAPADATATGLPDQSVDVVFSYGVLEHIPTDDLRRMFSESARILKANGKCYHNIGLHDHFQSAGLGNGVNFLRYSESYWMFMTGHALSYHNRLRLPEYFQIFEEAGLLASYSDTELTEQNLKAIDQLKIDQRFHGMSKVELATSHLYVDLVRADTCAKPNHDFATKANEINNRLVGATSGS
jgi:hypothetical protein